MRSQKGGFYGLVRARSPSTIASAEDFAKLSSLMLESPMDTLVPALLLSPCSAIPLPNSSHKTPFVLAALAVFANFK
eukprot:1744446-Rhodomonas_salina.2